MGRQGPLARRTRARFTARPGAPLRWSDGSPAGRVSDEVALPDDAAPDRPRPCFDRALAGPGGGHESALRLCVAPADLLESTAFLSDQQVAVVKPGTRRQVALRVDNRTSHPTHEIEAEVRTAARRRLYALGDVLLIPPGEDPEVSRARAERHHLTGYVAEVRIEETLGDAATGGMTQRLVDARLMRLDGTSTGQALGAHQTQQIESARPPAEEADALAGVLDEALAALAGSLRQDPREGP
jgi:hypothetical protein